METTAEFCIAIFERQKILVSNTTNINLPRLGTTSMWTFGIELILCSEERNAIGMLFTFDWKSVVDVTLFLQKLEELLPHFFTSSSFRESFRVSNHYECIACP